MVSMKVQATAAVRALAADMSAATRSCDSLAELAKTEEGFTALLEARALNAITTAVARHATDLGFAEAAARAVAAMAPWPESAYSELVQHRVAHATVSLIRAHLTSPVVTENGFNALADVADCKDPQALAVVDAGAVTAAVKELSRADAVARAAACKLLANVATWSPKNSRDNGDARKRFAEAVVVAGGPAAIIAALESSAGDVMLARNAATALTRIATAGFVDTMVERGPAALLAAQRANDTELVALRKRARVALDKPAQAALADRKELGKAVNDALAAIRKNTAGAAAIAHAEAEAAAAAAATTALPSQAAPLAAASLAAAAGAADANIEMTGAPPPPRTVPDGGGGGGGDGSAPPLSPPPQEPACAVVAPIVAAATASALAAASSSSSSMPTVPSGAASSATGAGNADANVASAPPMPSLAARGDDGSVRIDDGDDDEGNGGVYGAPTPLQLPAAAAATLFVHAVAASASCAAATVAATSPSAATAAASEALVEQADASGGARGGGDGSDDGDDGDTCTVDDAHSTAPAPGKLPRIAAAAAVSGVKRNVRPKAAASEATAGTDSDAPAPADKRRRGMVQPDAQRDDAVSLSRATAVREPHPVPATIALHAAAFRARAPWPQTIAPRKQVVEASPAAAAAHSESASSDAVARAAAASAGATDAAVLPPEAYSNAPLVGGIGGRDGAAVAVLPAAAPHPSSDAAEAGGDVAMTSDDAVASPPHAAPDDVDVGAAATESIPGGIASHAVEPLPQLPQALLLPTDELTAQNVVALLACVMPAGSEVNACSLLEAMASTSYRPRLDALVDAGIAPALTLVLNRARVSRSRNHVTAKSVRAVAVIVLHSAAGRDAVMRAGCLEAAVAALMQHRIGATLLTGMPALADALMIPELKEEQAGDVVAWTEQAIGAVIQGGATLAVAALGIGGPHTLAAMRVLHAMTDHSSANRGVVFTAGAAAAIKSTVANGNDAVLALLGCSALANLGNDDAVGRKVAHVSLTVAKAALDAHPTNGGIVEEATRAIGTAVSWSDKRSSHERVRAGVLECSVKALDMHGGSANITLNVASTLNNIADTDPAALVRAEAVAPLVAMRGHANGAIKDTAGRALRSICNANADDAAAVKAALRTAWGDGAADWLEGVGAADDAPAGVDAADAAGADC